MDGPSKGSDIAGDDTPFAQILLPLVKRPVDAHATLLLSTPIGALIAST